MKAFTKLASLLFVGAISASQIPVLDESQEKKTTGSNSFQFEIHNFDGWSYFTEISVGTPPQKFNVTVDTGVASTFIYSKQCWSMPCFYYNLFDKSKSSTFKDANGPKFHQPILSITGGNVEGNQAIEKVALSDDVKVDNLTFGLVSAVGGLDFVYNKVSGVMGLGYQSILSGGEPFLKSAGLSEYSYSVYLKGKGKRSYLHMPGMDLDNHEVVRTHKVVDKTYINLNLTHVGIPDAMTSTSGIFAMFATDFNSIAGPVEVLRPATGGIVVAKDCSNVDYLPPFTIGIDGFDYVLDPQDYVIRKHGECLSPFMPFDAPAPYNKELFIGQPMLKKFYLHVNMENDTVTFQRDKMKKKVLATEQQQQSNFFDISQY